MRYDARAHWRWIAETVELHELLLELRVPGERDRRRGLPWRELAAHEVRVLAGDQARAEDYAGRARRIEAVLPPALRPFVSLLVLNVDPPLVIGASRRLPQRDVARLHRSCRSRLLGKALTDTDSKWLRRKLTAIDPTDAYLKIDTGQLELGHVAAVNATAAAAGSWVHTVASTAGYLPVGQVVERERGRAVAPSFQFKRAEDV